MNNNFKIYQQKYKICIGKQEKQPSNINGVLVFNIINYYLLFVLLELLFIIDPMLSGNLLL